MKYKIKRLSYPDYFSDGKKMHLHYWKVVYHKNGYQIGETCYFKSFWTAFYVWTLNMLDL